MENYYKRVSNVSHFPEVEVDNSKRQKVSIMSRFLEVEVDNSKINCTSIDMTNLPTDLGLRPPISSYNPNIQDEIRRYYLQQGSCQPRSYEFPKTFFGMKDHRFNIAWFDQFSTLLEYSIIKDSAFFLFCYLFKSNIGKQAGGNTFVSEGFSNLKKMSILEKHNIKDRISYRVRLIASVDYIHFLVRQGLTFRGHDETQDSNNQVDESHDVSIKEQMFIMFCYVDKRRLRGQGYDGASNMSGEFNGLKSIIMKENECALFCPLFCSSTTISTLGCGKEA
ncbi:uncharacterized protein LOC133806191 [Humulus lupulus]|uniref:uncharacterized protein LOC133806191 n=1 Tax=Humulus lupulus TaxID=3486 RepID=UPI002B41174B|nr:uncharacterized protein LOC133806191 [Humulus lupulus]